MTRLLRWIVLLTGLALVATGCKFDGAYDLPLPGSPVDADHSYEVTAEFADILNVVPRSPVMVDDVTVGEVVDVERVAWHARITLRVRDDVTLPDNAIADIRQVSLLGEKYVALEAPTDETPTGTLSDGDNIPLADTGRNPEVEEVLGALSFLLSGGGVGQLGTITEELNNVMDGRTGRLRHLLGSLEDVVGTRVIGASKDDILKSLDHLQPILQKLNEAGDSLAPGLNLLVSFPFPKEASEVVSGDYANTSIRADINLENIIPNGDGGGGLPPVIPDPGQVLSQVEKCLKSGDITSKACLKVLDDVNLVKHLKKQCKKKKYDGNPVCTIVEAVPGDGGLPDLPGLPGLPGLGGLLGATGFGDALSSGDPSPTPSRAALYGGAP